MKSNLRSWAVVAVFAMMVTGCSIYHPQSVDIPMINHAGDTRVDANVALSTWVLPDVLTAGATVSYGFNDWLAGQAHLNFGGDNVYGQVAPGAYLPLGEHGLLEGYVGMGMGGAWRSRSVSSSDTSTYNYDYSGRFTIPFGQVNIGWHDLSAIGGGCLWGEQSSVDTLPHLTDSSFVMQVPCVSNMSGTVLSTVAIPISINVSTQCTDY